MHRILYKLVNICEIIMKATIKLLTSLAILSFALTSSLYARDLIELTETDDAIIEGEKEYQERCALCHGEHGKGDGPYSVALVFKPSDLTKLLNDDGTFPFLETFLIIDGRDMNKYHGTRLMPVWGDRYSQETWTHVSPEYANTLVRGRIFELILFLYSIQEYESEF